ncbi:MAG: hypothetical protein AUJ92_04125 [Armatimonadetes bacterium CG2_30_59_28]|nr:MAG: hypothetical protein AUJ92_04125 [Armatimonadetes bacterium CG2_30_59_28]
MLPPSGRRNDIDGARLRKAVVAIGCFVVTFLSASAEAREFTLVHRGKAQAVIHLGQKASWQDRFAAAELQRYVRQMTGATLPLHDASSDRQLPPGLPVLIGTLETHESLAQLAKEGKLRVSDQELTGEGFAMKTTEWRGQPCLALAGTGAVGAVYAVFDLLERYGRVGFFRYEEHVPKRSTFAIPSCDIRERPFFRVRMHGGQYHYYGIHFYSEAQWQEDLQWHAKYRINRQNYIPGPPVLSMAEAPLWKRLGIERSAGSEPREKEPGEAFAIVQRLAKYAAQFGVHAPLITSKGRLPAEVREQFQQRYPGARTITDTRNSETNVYVHPADPMWLRLNQTYLEHYIDLFGDTKVYYLPSPPAERSPGNTPEEQEEYTRSYAESVGRLADWAEKTHPGAEWMMDGWAFANHEYWQPYRVERLFNALPPKLNFVMWDYPAEDEPSYVFNNYWYGRPWAFIAFNSMNGNAAVHGDVNRLMGEVYRVLCDQRAKNLAGFGYYTEARDYVPFFKDLVLHLAWNPLRDLDEFTADYCQRRYDPRSVSAMVACHQKMLKTVYGPQSDTHLKDGFRTVLLQNPVYWYELAANWVPFDSLQERTVLLRKHWPPILQQALADALAVAKWETGNRAYQRDLVDLMRSYIHVCMNEAIWRAIESARKGDSAEFTKHQARVIRLFDYLLLAIGTVADRWEFGVNAMIQDFEDAPLRYTPEEIRHHLYYVTWGGDKIYDYARSDRYEMIRDIYRPMTEAYLEACRARLARGDKGLPPDEVRSKLQKESFQPTIEKFIKSSGPPPPPQNAADIAIQFLQAARRGEI